MRFYLRSSKVTAVIGPSDPISPFVKQYCHSKSFNYCLNHGWIACAEGMHLLHHSWKWGVTVWYCANSCSSLFETSSRRTMGNCSSDFKTFEHSPNPLSELTYRKSMPHRQLLHPFSKSDYKGTGGWEVRSWQTDPSLHLLKESSPASAV